MTTAPAAKRKPNATVAKKKRDSLKRGLEINGSIQLAVSSVQAETLEEF